MKNALILHGTGNNSQGNWFPWLKGELEKNGFVVWSPDLPGADTPNMKTYTDFLLHNSWEFNEESVLVGHSSGAVAILGLLQALPDHTIVNLCVLVGGFTDNLGRDDLAGLFDRPLNYEVIKKKSKKFILFHSDNDPHVPITHARILEEKLGAELVVIPGQEHFNLEASPSYTQFPQLLEEILKNA